MNKRVLSVSLSAALLMVLGVVLPRCNVAPPDQLTCLDIDGTVNIQFDPHPSLPSLFVIAQDISEIGVRKAQDGLGLRGCEWHHAQEQGEC